MCPTYNFRYTNFSAAGTSPILCRVFFVGLSSTPIAMIALFLGVVLPTLMKYTLTLCDPRMLPTFPIIPSWSTFLQRMRLPSRLTSTLKAPTLVRCAIPFLTLPSTMISLPSERALILTLHVPTIPRLIPMVLEGNHHAVPFPWLFSSLFVLLQNQHWQGSQM